MTHKLSQDQHQGKAMKLEEELKQCEEEQRNAATLVANGHHILLGGGFKEFYFHPCMGK